MTEVASSGRSVQRRERQRRSAHWPEFRSRRVVAREQGPGEWTEGCHIPTVSMWRPLQIRSGRIMLHGEGPSLAVVSGQSRTRLARMDGPFFVSFPISRTSQRRRKTGRQRPETHPDARGKSKQQTLVMKKKKKKKVNIKRSCPRLGDPQKRTPLAPCTRSPGPTRG